MKNFWLQRRPQIYQQLNPYADFYGKWFIIKCSDTSNLYLHKDGTWRPTTFNSVTRDYSAYFDTLAEVEKIIKKFT